MTTSVMCWIWGMRISVSKLITGILLLIVNSFVAFLLNLWILGNNSVGPQKCPSSFVAFKKGFYTKNLNFNAEKREAASGRTLSTSLATDQDYSYSEVHQASFSHHLSFLCFNFYIIMLSGPTVCDCPRTSVNGMNEWLWTFRFKNVFRREIPYFK